jgi:hypothetical protein
MDDRFVVPLGGQQAGGRRRPLTHQSSMTVCCLGQDNVLPPHGSHAPFGLYLVDCLEHHEVLSVKAFEPFSSFQVRVAHNEDSNERHIKYLLMFALSGSMKRAG